MVGRNLDIRCPWNITVNSHTLINKRVVIDGREGLAIGNNVDIAQDAQIWTLQHDVNGLNHCRKGARTTINDYAWIGTISIILPEVTIGRGAVIGAVVTKDVSEMAIVRGILA